MSNTDNKAISVIICTFNRAGSLGGTLDSFLGLEGDAPWAPELVVVDNNSTDQTPAVVERYRARLGDRLKYVFEPRQGLSAARNKGVRAASGEILAFVDDDVVLDTKWLKAVRGLFSDSAVDAGGGRVLPVYPHGAPLWILDSKDILGGPMPYHDYGEGARPYDRSMYPFVGANIFFRRALLARVGEFREDLGVGAGCLGEDSEMFLRAREAGGRLVYCGQALVWHKIDASRMNLRYLRHWFVQAGRTQARMSDDERSCVCYGGVPRYLFRMLPQAAVAMAFGLGRSRSFLCAYRDFFLTAGAVQEYRWKARARGSAS